MTVKTRETTYSGYDSPINKNDKLTHSEVDNNWIGLIQKIYDVLPTGVCLPYVGSSAPQGWLLADGNTIGSSTSNANYKSNDFIRLFKLLWNESLGNTTALMAYDSYNVLVDFSTETTSSDDAWSDGYYIALPDLREKTVIGQKVGDITDSLFKSGGIKSQDTSHTHTSTLATDSAGIHSHSVSGTSGSGGNHSHNINALSIANAGSHNHNASTESDHSHTVPVTPIAIPDGSPGADQAVAYPMAPLSKLLTDTASASLNITTDGDHTHTLASGTTDEVNGHTHAISINTTSTGNHSHTISGDINGITQSVSTIPPYLSLSWIIKYSYGV